MLKDTLIIVHKVKILITLLRTKEVLDLYVELQNRHATEKSAVSFCCTLPLQAYIQPGSNIHIVT